jgi:hypothetical protein
VFVDKQIAIWKKYTMLEDDLIRKRTGKPVVFFLQPNQYLKGSKSLSEEENRIAIDPHRVEDTNEMMVSLRTAVQDLRHDGVPIFDLTNIFLNITDTVYKDDCCHLNNLGNRFMADAVISKVMLNQSGTARQTSIH